MNILMKETGYGGENLTVVRGGIRGVNVIWPLPKPKNPFIGSLTTAHTYISIFTPCTYLYRVCTINKLPHWYYVHSTSELTSPHPLPQT